MGMTTRVTTASTTFWNSSSTWVMALARVHVAARPTRTEKTSADITLIMGSISRLNSTVGSSRRLSAADWMDSAGIRTKPAPMDIRAAHTEEV